MTAKTDLKQIWSAPPTQLATALQIPRCTLGSNINFYRSMVAFVYYNAGMLSSEEGAIVTHPNFLTVMIAALSLDEGLGQLTRKEEKVTLTPSEQCVYTILTDKQWYSYSSAATMRLCRITHYEDLRSVCASLSTKVKDPINFFTYNEVEYIGFETRRLDYKRDKLAGTNPIEKLIAQGVYERRL